MLRSSSGEADHQVPEGAATERLDVFLASNLGVSRSQIQKRIESGAVVVNGKLERASYLVEPGDKVSIEQPESQTKPDINPPNIPIIYEDDDLMVVDKPSGLSMHPGSGETVATLADFSRLHSADPDPDRPGIVHRLDKDTSGLVVIAKTLEAKVYLQGLFKDHKVKKTYSLLVVGRPGDSEAIIKLPLDRDPENPLRRAVISTGREAITRYHTIANYHSFSLIEAIPETGRTHQLRVHFEAIGHPIAGDPVYAAGREKPRTLRRLFLHAAKLQFKLPSGKQIQIQSPLPGDLNLVLGTLEGSS